MKKPMTWLEFRARLFALWTEACESWEGSGDAPPAFAEWSGASKDVLLGLNMFWKDDRYTFPPPLTRQQEVGWLGFSLFWYLLGKAGDMIEFFHPAKDDDA